MAAFKKLCLKDKPRGRPSFYSKLINKISFKRQKRVKMGQNYAKYCHISGMLKDPVETFETSRTYREAIHGPSDFILMVKGKFFEKTIYPLKYKIVRILKY